MKTTPCPVLGADTVCITDIEGRITRIICGAYDEMTGECALRKEAARGGPLSRLLQRAATHSLASSGTACILA